MTTPEDKRSEVEAREAEYRRLDQVAGVVEDMHNAAFAMEEANGFRGCGFEQGRWDYAVTAFEEVSQERSTAYHRFLAAEYGEAEAVRIRTEAKAWVDDQLRQRRAQRTRGAVRER